MAIKTKYCTPPHSGTSEFEITFSVKSRGTFRLNPACDNTGIVASSDIEDTGSLTSTKIEGCPQCIGWESHREYIVQENVEISLYYKNAVPNWQYNINVIFKVFKRILVLSGIDSLGNCISTIIDDEIGDNVYPIKFTPDSTNGMLAKIQYGTIDGQHVEPMWEFLPC